MYKCWEKYVQIILLGSANTELTLIAAGEISPVQMDFLLVGQPVPPVFEGLSSFHNLSRLNSQSSCASFLRGTLLVCSSPQGTLRGNAYISTIISH